jgi:hypothetical protein
MTISQEFKQRVKSAYLSGSSTEFLLTYFNINRRKLRRLIFPYKLRSAYETITELSSKGIHVDEIIKLTGFTRKYINSSRSKFYKGIREKRKIFNIIKIEPILNS